MIIKIKDWDIHFENSQSKRIKRAHWIPLPNKHDGKGYKRIAKREDACEIFTAWVLMVQLASKMPTRGVLVDTDGPLTPEDMADKTDYPEAIFQKGIEVLSAKKINWIEVNKLQK